ncbi:MAG: hypothetical protein ACOC1F_13410, partial [Myxococcota bacterium]
VRPDSVVGVCKLGLATPAGGRLTSERRSVFLPAAERTGLCDKAAAGEIDDVWLMGAGWFGFWESAFYGPLEASYPFNGPAYEAVGCADRLIPVMGFNYSRGTGGAGHIWGHRTEATFTHLFQGWSQDSVDTHWDRFGLSAGQSPTLGYSGCGSIHWPPNASQDYDYGNPATAQSMCDDFLGYPGLAPDPATEVKPVDCGTWGCTETGFYEWWFRHLPQAPGEHPELGVSNDWWTYVIDPDRARACRSMDDVSCEQESRCEWTAAGCFPRGLACPPSSPAPCDACLGQGTVQACDGTLGCSWYACVGLCYPTGTPVEDICG